MSLASFMLCLLSVRSTITYTYIIHRKSEEQQIATGLRFKLLASNEISLKLHIRVSNFQTFSCGGMPPDPPRMLVLRTSQSVLHTLFNNSSHWQHHVYSSSFNIYNGLTNFNFPSSGPASMKFEYCASRVE